MGFNFVVDRVVKGRAYPTLAEWTAEPYTPEWREFTDKYPYTVPCELIDHCETFGVDYRLWTVGEDYPAGSFYLIGIGFFDFSIDYYSLMSETVLDQLRSGRLVALFYYHEGDNPYDLQITLGKLCIKHNLPFSSYRFVSGNSIADNTRNGSYFPDHELLYWRRNQSVPATAIHTGPRQRDFTVLSRTHKWWRATVMADLHRNGLLTNSYWSYNTDIAVDQDPESNSIDIDLLNLRYYLEQFVNNGPYTCDDLTAEQHNNHALVNTEHYSNSYCNIVLETHLDCEQTIGTFLTEKTFKPIKHGQPFIIVGPQKTLKLLRELGYRTFDSVIDPAYDLISNDTDRWRMVFEQIVRIKTCDRQQFIEQCLPDIKHNQQLFLSTKADRLNILYDKLLHQLAAP